MDPDSYNPESQKFGDEKNQEENTNKNVWKQAYDLPIRWMIKKTDFMPQIGTINILNKDQNVREIRNVFQQAFKLWDQESHFKFVELADESTAEIKISFGEEEHG